MPLVLGDPTRNSIPIVLTSRSGLKRALDALPPEARAYAHGVGYDAAPGAHLLVPNAKGAPAAVLFGLAESGAERIDPMAFGRLATLLPRGRYRIAEGGEAPEHAELAFLLSAYTFARYRKPKSADVVLEAPRGARRERAEAIAEAVALGRDLINTPANDLGPNALEQAALAVARKHKARAKVISGDALKRGFPLVHAVGKGAAEGPRLVDISWGARKGPKITLVISQTSVEIGAVDSVFVAGVISMNESAGAVATLSTASDFATCANFLASRRQPNSWLTLTPCALATAEMLASRTLASARIRSFAA